MDSEVSRAGATIFGDLIFYDDLTLAAETLRLVPATGDITATGQLSLLSDRVRIEPDAATGEPVFLMEDGAGAERVRMNGETGEMTLNGDLVLTGTVDGVDLSAVTADLQADIDQEISDRQAGDNGLQDQITTANANITTLNSNVTTLNSNVTTLQSTTSSINNLPGTLSESKIDGAITRDSELTFPNIGGTIAAGQIAPSTAIISGGQIVDGTVTTADLSPSSFAGWDQSAGDDFTQGQGDARYALLGHNHDASYAAISHNHDATYVNVEWTPIKRTVGPVIL